jgi:hypothetical protein
MPSGLPAGYAIGWAAGMVALPEFPEAPKKMALDRGHFSGESIYGEFGQ